MRKRPGSVLIEVLVAVAILVGSGTAIMAAADRGERLLRSSRELSRAGDLARSVIAAIEAGLVTPQSAPQAVRSAAETGAWLALDADAGLPELTESAGWRVEVDVEPTVHAGLARATVKVWRMRGEGLGAEGEPLFVLTQLVRVLAEGEDKAGDSLLPEESPAGGRGGRR
ncbi:MAG: hypothetical protein HEQ23_09425 [Tepidisphaera sp.]